MNKKFSTLVAGALLAGALITPTDLFAKLVYVTGDYSAAAEASPSATDFYIVTSDGYVISVGAGATGLVRTSLADATPANKVTLTGSGTYGIASGANKLAFASTNDAFVAFGTSSAIEAFTIASSGEEVSIKNASAGSVNYASNVFSVQADVNGKIAGAKLVAVNTLKVYRPLDVATDLSSSFYVLMDPASGNVLTGAADGTATSETYTAEQDMFWSLDIIDNGDNTGTAKLKNKATGKYLIPSAGAAFITIDVNRTDKNSPWKVDDFEDVDLSAAVTGINAVSLGAVRAAGQSLTGEQLTSITGAGFEASIKKFVDGDKKDKALANNPFDGLLKTVTFNDGTAGKVLATVKAENGTPFMLQNEDGNIIVIDLNDKYAAGTETKYAVKAIAPKVLANALNDAKAEISGRYAYNFTINASDDFVPGVNQPVASISAATKGNAASYKLGSVDLKGVPTLSAEASTDAFLNAITIKIGKFNTIDVKKLLTSTPSFFTVTNKNTKAAYSDNYKTVLGLDETPAAEYVKASEALNPA